MRKKSSALTPRQREIYTFIKKFIKIKGISPTLREIGNAFEINSPNGVVGHIRTLVRKGYITYKSRLARTIQLVNKENSYIVDDRIIDILKATYNNKINENSIQDVINEVILTYCKTRTESGRGNVKEAERLIKEYEG